MNKPFIIVVDGLDGSGKETQTKKLRDHLLELGYTVESIDYPQYEKWHSFLVRFYLKGKFAKDPGKINPYLASFFYAFDRFVSHYTMVRKLKNVDFILFDRYVEANMIFQGLKANSEMKIENHNAFYIGVDAFENNKKLQKILKFIRTLEYGFFRLPHPDIVFALNLNVEQVISNLHKRGKTLDIHENEDTQIKAYYTLQYLINKYNWTNINCMKSEHEMSSIDCIHGEIFKIVADRYKNI